MKARIAELRAGNARKSELTREEALRWLADLIRTPIGSVGKDSPLVQSYEVDSEGKTKVRLADKLAGMQTLCRMTGWNEPDRIKLSTDDHCRLICSRSERSRRNGVAVRTSTIEPGNLENGEANCEEGHRQGAAG